MELKFASCKQQYSHFPKLISGEVLKLQDWYNKQPHSPSITGGINLGVQQRKITIGQKVVVMDLNIERTSADKSEMLSRMAFENETDVITVQETHIDDPASYNTRGNVTGFKVAAYVTHDKVTGTASEYSERGHFVQKKELEAICFLHACYYSVEQAKVCLDTYHTARTHWPEFFKNRNVEGIDVTSQMKVVSFTLLPKLTTEGYGVILCRLMDCDASKFNFSYAVKLFGMITDLWFAENDLREGYATVIDMKGTTLMHLARINIVALRKFMFYIQDALPIRLKAIHFINTVSFMDKVLALMRPFMKKELMDILHFHSTMDTFVDKFVPRNALPDEYNGTGGKMNKMQDEACNHVRNNAKYFEEEELTKRVNEKLRQGKPHGDGDIYGIDGSFKQLSFD
ncbi:Alpha-tocopherol transfer protein-like [Pseudolycoriella hygida]|uniref:Alpha-tocopherol transfer protein-like n=1 Tax=Pseudolycoriella hygida TaxID=35572 RepID=A0A9Q0MSM7_9DIPT|nr:Alpha-tocopherol transfer protein-like [Pseudolycoriella hygida]